jgi:uncharacterized membrane protein
VNRRVRPEAQWLGEAVRTNLWLVPAAEVVGATLLFLVTRALDAHIYNARLSLPSWVISGSADAARQILTTLAAALITVVGVVFSIILVALTLTSTQFGPRMLRNFIRDRGTQWTLGTFVATFVYSMLDLVAIGPGPHGDFIPHISITVALGLTLIDVGVLIYFIHHIAVMIQLPQVIASIAGDLDRAINAETAAVGKGAGGSRSPADSAAETVTLRGMLAREGGIVTAPSSGYLQFVRRSVLIGLAVEQDAVIQLHHRPGHFVARGDRFATVWPARAAPSVQRRLSRSHITGPYRTLTQDVAFAVDQLVEIAIRALSPAVNDTFTALTCIDWLGDSLCRIAADWDPDPVCRDGDGLVRLITVPVSYERLVERAHEKIRQASAGMPAVMIRQLANLVKITQAAQSAERRAVLLRQAEMIRRLCEQTVGEENDRADVERRYREVLALNTVADTVPGSNGGSGSNVVQGSNKAGSNRVSGAD